MRVSRRNIGKIIFGMDLISSSGISSNFTSIRVSPTITLSPCKTLLWYHAKIITERTGRCNEFMEYWMLNYELYISIKESNSLKFTVMVIDYYKNSNDILDIKWFSCVWNKTYKSVLLSISHTQHHIKRE